MSFRNLSLNINLPRLSLSRQNSSRSRDSQTPEAAVSHSDPGSPSSTSGVSDIEEIDEAQVVTEPALASPTSLKPSSPWPFGSSISRTRSDTLTALTVPLNQIVLSSVAQTSAASKLPHEILLAILRLVSSINDLKSCIQVCKSWCQCSVELLWHKPVFAKLAALEHYLNVIQLPEPTFPYPIFIRRLNFSLLSDHIQDPVLLILAQCVRLERLTLSGCSKITDFGTIKLLTGCRNLVALDLSECSKLTNATCLAIAENSKRLQGLNLGGCKEMDDEGIIALARKCSLLKRMKLRQLLLITDLSIINLARSCPHLLEIDLYGCSRISDPALWAIWRNLAHVRELTLNGANVTDTSMPVRGEDGQILVGGGNHHEEIYANARKAQASSMRHLVTLPTTLIAGESFYTSVSPKHFDHIRVLDLTAQVFLTDKAIDSITAFMPRLRSLVLAKCTSLTDESVFSICRLGKYLHYLHLGHVAAITDRAVIALARSCTRLRYIDLACCAQLTDMSVAELATLIRLKRIGLVRVAGLTDQAIFALGERKSLERIHLSYCDSITVHAIHFLLQHLTQLIHLSLTGVPAFRRSDLQAYCRSPPTEFNAQQQQAFCVYSGRGVVELRRYLNACMTAEEDGVEIYEEPSRQRRHDRHANLRQAQIRGGTIMAQMELHRGFDGPVFDRHRMGGNRALNRDVTVRPNVENGPLQEQMMQTPAQQSRTTRNATQAAHNTHIASASRVVGSAPPALQSILNGPASRGPSGASQIMLTNPTWPAANDIPPEHDVARSALLHEVRQGGTAVDMLADEDDETMSRSRTYMPDSDDSDLDGGNDSLTPPRRGRDRD